ncbi:hypothetical protein [Rudaea cellulosilytica]|uniref:hypothetical protein n=1 Tax=Rudaea cellulosilytica TaxID=540746 RepID=UPI0012FB9DC8|nr:hypothetical protein [Rudaea cellulosilytica]
MRGENQRRADTAEQASGIDRIGDHVDAWRARGHTHDLQRSQLPETSLDNGVRRRRGADFGDDPGQPLCLLLCRSEDDAKGVPDHGDQPVVAVVSGDILD